MAPSRPALVLLAIGLSGLKAELVHSLSRAQNSSKNMERLVFFSISSKHSQITTGSPEPIWQLVRVAAEQLVHPQPAGGGGPQQASGLLHLPLQDVKA